MFFAHRIQGQMDDYLQYLFDHDIIGPAMPSRYFQNRANHAEDSASFPVGSNSSVCVNYTNEAIQMALTRFSTLLVGSDQSCHELVHHDVGLSQESYDAPEADEIDDLEGIYDFMGRDIPPVDPDVPLEEQANDDTIASSAVDSDVECDADDIMCHDDETMQDILESDDMINLNGFIKLMKDNMREQLDLLEQYSRSGNCTTEQYNLRQVAKDCMGPMIDFCLKVAADIAKQASQNVGQTHVSSNCINPTSRRRVRGAKWGLFTFTE